MLENQYYHDEEAKAQRSYFYRVAGFFLLWVVLAFVFSLLLGWAGNANAEPIARATAGGVVITVYSEDCALKDVVSNLPKRATWEENGKKFEGCAAGNADVGVAVFYFKEDRTVAVVPLQAFQRVTGV